MGFQGSAINLKLLYPLAHVMVRGSSPPHFHATIIAWYFVP